ncbi:fungal-specific transcription factor domain-containing protein [Sordaria sp. MPI-SDFR-AT-0083]|nr:fungal-specific transcription factor domain-containing protein [Sordaria sp. MPI-SDFR-AT-0083]
MSILRRNDRSPSAGVSESSSPDFISHTPRSLSSSKQQQQQQQVRHRASVACASCRERRIRCVVPDGESGCTQCKKTGAECIIRNDDERRRPISKAYMSSLSNRITLLEEMLRERGVAPPPAVHPPKTRQEAKEMQEHEQHDVRFREDFETPGPNQANSSMAADTPSPPKFSVEETQTDPVGDDNNNKQTSEAAPSNDSTLFPEFTSQWNGDVRQFLGVKSRFSVMSGRLQYFGSTASSHVHAQNTSQPSPPTIDHASRVERVIRILGSSTHDHLMSCFWVHYNPTVQVVDREIFDSGRKSQNPRHYSVFLHITMLAAGYRFAERSREDVKRLILGNWESTFHRESKSMLDAELERPGGIPSTQALLILADLEFGAGRDSTGWMYSGMANRLAIDIGLHVTVPKSGSEVLRAEEPLRRRVMTACVLFDRYWALLLGRSPSIRHRDIGIELGLKPTKGTAMPTASPTIPFDMVTSQSPEISLHQHLLELMSIAAKILELQNQHEYAESFANNKSGEEAYQRLFALDRKLQAWYRRLPDFLAWKPANIQAAPVGFFMLHQQFHTCMILLHRPWAMYDNEDGSNPVMSFGQSPRSLPGISHHHRVAIARRMCTQHAIRVARIFWHHRLRFDGRKLPIFAIQQAGTSAIALMAALMNRTTEVDQQSNLRYLQVLSAAIYDMCYIYQPAARMYRLLKSMLVDIRNEVVTGVSGVHAQSRTSPEVTASVPPPFLQYTHQRSYSTPLVGLNFGAPDWATRGTSLSGGGGDTHGYSQFPGRQQPENDLFGENKQPPSKRQRCSGPSRRTSDFGGCLTPSLFNIGGYGGISSYPTPPLTSPRDSGEGLGQGGQAKDNDTSIPDAYTDDNALFDFDFLESTALDTVTEEPNEEQHGVEGPNKEYAETDFACRAASTPTVSSHSHQEGRDAAEENADKLAPSDCDANKAAAEESTDLGAPRDDQSKASPETAQDPKASVSAPATSTAPAQEEDADSNIIEEWLAEPLPSITTTSSTINPAALTTMTNTVAPIPALTTMTSHHLARFQPIISPHRQQQQHPSPPSYKRDARLTKHDHPDLFPRFNKSAIIDALVGAAGINFDLSLCREVDVEDRNYDNEHDGDAGVVNDNDGDKENQRSTASGKDGSEKGEGQGQSQGQGPSRGSAAHGVSLSDLLGSMGGHGGKRRMEEVEGGHGADAGAGLGCGYAIVTNAAKPARKVELDYFRL